MENFFQTQMSEEDALRAVLAGEEPSAIEKLQKFAGTVLPQVDKDSYFGDPIRYGRDSEQPSDRNIWGKQWSFNQDTLEFESQPYVPFSGQTPVEEPVTVVTEPSFEHYDPSQPKEPVTGGPEPLAPGLVVSDVMEGHKEAYDTEIAKALKGERNALSARFGDQIERLRSDLHAYALGKTDINQAYKAYTNTSGSIMRQAIIDAEGLAPTDVVEQVGRSYDRAEGAMNEALLAIDTTGRPEMAAAMNGELRFWENSITKALTADIEMGDLLHTTASDYAKAMAQAAYSDDQYRAEEERVKIQLQLESAIRDKQEEIARQNAAWRKAEQALVEQQEEFGEDWTPQEYDEYKDQVRFDGARKYMMSMGMTAEQAREGWNRYLAALDASTEANIGGKISSNQDWFSWYQETVNEEALSRISINGAPGNQAYNAAVTLRNDTINALNDDDTEDPKGFVRQQLRDEIDVLTTAKRNLNFADWDEPTTGVLALVYGWAPENQAWKVNAASLNPFDENSASITDDFHRSVVRLYEYDLDFSANIDSRFNRTFR